MPRQIFISFAADREPVFEGFNLVDVAGSKELTFTGRHEFGIADAGDLREKVVQELSRSSVTIVLIDDSAEGSEVISRDIELSLDQGIGLLGIKLDPRASTPDALYEAGAEVLDWSDTGDVEHFAPALEAAARGAVILKRAATLGTGTGAPCQRRPR